MKTFKDLEFNNHPLSPEYFSKAASLTFCNGYGVSVIAGEMAYSNDERPYELAVLKDGDLCYDTEITDDVLGYLTEQDVTEVMKKVQLLK